MARCQGGVFYFFHRSNHSWAVVSFYAYIITDSQNFFKIFFSMWQRQFTFGNERSEITLVIGFDLLPLFYQVPYLYSTGFFIHPLLLYFTDGKERTQGFMNCCAALDFFLSHPVCSTYEYSEVAEPPNLIK